MGFRYGELLLRDVLYYAEQNAFGFLFVEVFPKQERLITFLNDFGFYDLRMNTRRGELRLGKKLTFSEGDIRRYSRIGSRHRDRTIRRQTNSVSLQ